MLQFLHCAARFWQLLALVLSETMIARFDVRLRERSRWSCMECWMSCVYSPSRGTIWRCESRRTTENIEAWKLQRESTECSCREIIFVYLMYRMKMIVGTHRVMPCWYEIRDACVYEAPCADDKSCDHVLDGVVKLRMKRHETIDKKLED